MSIPLFKTTIKNNWLLLLIFFGVLTMYMTIMISMYNPDDMQAITSMLELFPEEMMNAMGFSGAVTDLTGYLASWLYGLLMFGFPMVYCIILGNKLVAKKVDNGSMAYLLSTPASRTKIIVTQGVYALLSVVLLFAALFGVGVVTSIAMFPDLLDIGAFFKLNVLTMLINMAIIMITFFFSCLFNDTKYSLGFGAGFPILFLLMNMLGGASDKLEILKKLSIYGLQDPVELVHDKDALGLDLFFAGIIALLFLASVLVFRRKRLPL